MLYWVSITSFVHKTPRVLTQVMPDSTKSVSMEVNGGKYIFFFQTLCLTETAEGMWGKRDEE